MRLPKGRCASPSTHGSVCKEQGDKNGERHLGVGGGWHPIHHALIRYKILHIRININSKKGEYFWILSSF